MPFLEPLAQINKRPHLLIIQTTVHSRLLKDEDPLHCRLPSYPFVKKILRNLFFELH